jgi:predicted nucleic acid-binding protein
VTGIDTTWLVDLEVTESPRHEGALRLFDAWRGERSTALCVYHHVFLEFLHVVTDPARFERPLSMDQAVDRVWFWAGQERLRILYPSEKSMKRCLMWLTAYRLGRMRLIDTQMAATYAEEGITRIWSANPGDFALFGVFELPEY